MSLIADAPDLGSSVLDIYIDDEVEHLLEIKGIFKSVIRVWV